MGPVDPGGQHQEADRRLALQVVRHADDGALGDVRMARQHLFHAAGGKAVAGDVDDVVGAGHDVDVAILVDIAGVGGLVVAGESLEIGREIAVVGVPERGEAARRHRQLGAEGADLAGRQLVAAFIQHAQVPAGGGLGRRAVLDRQDFDAGIVRRDRPAGLRLPPVIDHRHAELLLGPLDRIGVGAFARQEQRLEAGEVVLLDQLAFGIVPADGAEGRRRGEHRLDVVILDDPPEDARVRRADGLAFE